MDGEAQILELELDPASLDCAAQMDCAAQVECAPWMESDFPDPTDPPVELLPEDIQSDESPYPHTDEAHIHEVAAALAHVTPAGARSGEGWFLFSALGASLLLHGVVIAGCFVFGLVLYLPPHIDSLRAGAEGGYAASADPGPPPGDLLPAASPSAPTESAERIRESFPADPVPSPALDLPETEEPIHEQDPSPLTPIGIIAPSSAPKFPHRSAPVPAQPATQPSQAAANAPATSSDPNNDPVNAAVPAHASIAATGAHHAPFPPRPLGGGGAGSSSGYDANGMPIPFYPTESRRRREEGLVELDLEVLSSGAVGEVRVIHDPGYPRLVAAALAAARTAHFQPGTADGVPVAAHFTVPYRFVLR